MAPAPRSLVLGNELLLARDPDYPHGKRFKVRQHTVEAVADILSALHPPAPEWLASAPSGVQSALDVFVGYVMLDGWIANIDRHHENWAAVWHPEASMMRLAPTFDHGAALARNLLDSDRAERLTTKDRNRTVAAFAARGRSEFFASADDAKPLELREAFRAFAAAAPRAAAAWLERLRSLDRAAVWDIVESVPRARMSETCQRFTVELLMVNQARLLEPT